MAHPGDSIMNKAKTAVPLNVIGRMVLDCWPNNLFAETEHVAYRPANAVPGIVFSNDPLLLRPRRANGIGKSPLEPWHKEM
jgi:catalase